MGCDYYHEAILADQDDTDEAELSDQDGELTLVVKVYDEGGKVERRELTVDVPVGGKVYLDRLTSDEVWAR